MLTEKTQKKMNAFTKKWDGHCFSSSPVAGKDYLSFQRESKALLAMMAEDIGCELYKFNKNHYEFSAVLRHLETGAFVYVSISDVRIGNKWHTNVLYRTMKHDADWTGGQNNFCSLENLAAGIARLLPQTY